MTMRTRKLIKAALLIGASVGVIAALPGAGSKPARAAAGDSGIVCTDGPTFRLRASSGYISTPDGNSLLMWGYGPAGGSFQMPGPVLCVEQNQTVTVELTNDLAEPVSIVFPGQEGVKANGVTVQPQFDSGGTLTSLTNVAPPGGSVTYSFTASEPGTYLYESGTEPDKQVQMGLYGALIVRPAGHPNWAYDDARTAFDPTREYLLVLHDIDPELHYAVEHGRPYRPTKMLDRYWTINGRSFPDSISDNFVSWLPNQPYGSLVTVEASDPAAPGLPALIRYANAGVVNHPFHPHANHLREIARDGRLLEGPGGEDSSMESFTRTMGSGETADLQFQWIDVDGWRPADDPSPNPIPGFQLPGLQNLTFKDGVTFYSGSPYLGKQDDLPVGTTSFNQCGEFYFPWHSHALNEFQNFDEGFGGLATVLRVNPAGGCSP
jgi:FtsP/CotA-like multicopper oxidase with cupredoxin domain